MAGIGSSTSGAESAAVTARIEVPQMMYSIASLCPTPLSEGNYLVWKNQFEGALQIHNLLDFVSGKLGTPALRLSDGSENPAYASHKRNDGIVLSWIKATVCKEIQPLLLPCVTAYEAWHILETDISPIDKNQIQALRDELNSLRKTTDISMKEYIFKIKSLKHSLAAAGYSMSDERVSEYVLRGLGPEFRMFRTSLNFQKDITFTELADALIKEEILMKQLDQPTTEGDYQVHYSNYNRNNFNRNAKFYPGRGKNGGSYYKPSYKNQGTKVITVPSQIARNNLPPILNLPSSQDNTSACQICEKKGHLARNCPDRGNFAAYAMEDDYDTQITGNEEEAAAHSVTVQDLDWCLDSGATNHMVADEALLHDCQTYTEIDGSDGASEKLGFEKISQQIVDECKSTATLYRHKKTGAQVMSVSNDDENKVFGIVFRTPPKNSTGIPHILEHSVLCGSRKYPLKEPFVELLKGSLNTFLNAFTYPDRTCYPVASTNTKDFYNLVDVYLDAVFYPKCMEDFQTFQQEGWHYELNKTDEDVSFKGVVFNEMKGVYSQPDNIMGRVAQQALFPDNTYGVDSGGDPAVIPNLTYEEFKDFYKKYYHPSNSRIWFYGDDDINERLRILSAYLDQFDASASPKESKIEPQKLFSEPLRIVEKYPASDTGDLKKNHMVSINWLLSEKPLDLQTELTLGFLDHLLLGTPASPLRRILLESGLGEAIIGGGVEDELFQPQFSIGLKGVSEDDISKVEELVMDTLKKIAEEGFNNEAVEASMNTIEFSLRENNTGSFPRGLSLMLRSMGKWIYDSDPFEPLKYEKPLQSLKSRITAEGSKAVFSPLIEKFILNNLHRVTVEMQPDPEMASRDEAVEKGILEKLKASMTKEDLSELVRATQDLRLKQETPDPPEALKSIPSLSLKDIPEKPTHIPSEIDDINGVNVLQHDLFTNEILYSEVVFDMRSLKQDLLPLVPLFCQSLLEMGTKDLDFVQLNQLIGRKTGGISVYPLTSSIRGKEDPCCHLIVRGKSMAGKAGDLFDLMNCILQDVQFTDQQRFKQFVSQSKSRMENRLRGNGHGIAAARMDAKLNVAGWISEQMGGISYLEFLRDLENKVDQSWPEISSSLEEIRRTLLTKNGCLVNLTADGKNLSNSAKYVSNFLDKLPNSPPADLITWNARLSPQNEAIVIPTQVNYVGKAANIYETGYQLHGSAFVISKYIGNTWLWDRVRVSGGAYGGFCDFDTHSGVFSFLSYRDPNLLKTLDVYDGTAGFLRDIELDNDTLTKAIIGTIGDEDSYQLPDAKGYTSLLRHLLGVTNEEREMRREEILSTSMKNFKEFSDAVEAVKNKGVVVAVASPDDVTASNKEKNGFFNVKNVL